MSVIELKVPTIGESITEVTLARWLKADGEYVERDEAICEFESDKATLEFPAEAAGKLIHVAKEGEDLKIGAVIAKLDTEALASKVKEEPKETKKEEVKEAEKPATENKTQEEVKPDQSSYANGTPSPAAAKLMAENKLDAGQISATGKDGRIRKEDVMNTLEKKPAEITPQEKPKEQPTEQPVKERTTVSTFSRNTREEKMSRMRRNIAARLVSAKNNTAMLTTFNEVDMTAIIELRKTYQDRFVEKFGIKLGFMSLFAKACAKALMEMPEVNGSIKEESIIYHDFVDISVAISTPTGLVVPPVHNVESLGLADIELKIKELADKARTGKLSLEEMSGGTFTITNGGIFGSMMSTPILNEPQSAILGMHAIIERPVAINGQIQIRPMMYLALSYDHRIIDGSTSVTFLVKVKKYLEDPMSLFLI